MFIYNLEDVAKKLKIDFEGITKQIKHNGVKGSSREDLLKDYLKKLLPEKYSISSGIIIDNNQKQSKQQDFIIHDAFNCPSFFKTESNSILPIESVYATIEVKSTLDYSTLEQSVKNVESVRNLIKLPNRNIIRNQYDNVYPLGFVFAYTSTCSLEQIQKKLFELNKNINGRHQISIICILDKGLIFNVQKNNVTEVTLIPSSNTLLGRSDSGLESTLYSFYLFLLEYLDNVHIQIPSLIEYARKNNSFKVSINIPNELIPDDAVYKEGTIELKYGDARKMLNLNNKYPNLFNGKMTYEELFNYLKDDFIPLCKLQAAMAKVRFHNKVTIYGYEFTTEEFTKFEEYSKNYYHNFESKEKFDNIVNIIYAQYRKEVEEKEKMKKNYLILHGSFGSNEGNWFPWLKEQLEKNNKKVLIPQMPVGVGNQNFENWSNVLNKLDINENTVIIAHSIAPIFVCKYLITNQIKVKKLIFVCGFNNYSGIDSDFDAVNEPMFIDNFDDVKKYCKDIVCYYSDNDPYVKYDVEKAFADKLTDKQYVIKNGGHINAETGYTKFEEILKEI